MPEVGGGGECGVRGWRVVNEGEEGITDKGNTIMKRPGVLREHFLKAAHLTPNLVLFTLYRAGIYLTLGNLYRAGIYLVV